MGIFGIFKGRCRCAAGLESDSADSVRIPGLPVPCAMFWCFRRVPSCPQSGSRAAAVAPGWLGMERAVRSRWRCSPLSCVGAPGLLTGWRLPALPQLPPADRDTPEPSPLRMEFQLCPFTNQEEIRSQGGAGRAEGGSASSTAGTGWAQPRSPRGCQTAPAPPLCPAGRLPARKGEALALEQHVKGAQASRGCTGTGGN